MTGSLEGRVAIVTGAGRGIGREHALLLAAEGALVVVNDVGSALDGSGTDSGPADDVVQEIVEAGGRAVANADSVTSFEACRSLVEETVEIFGDLHIVVNNAGILRDRMLVSMSEDEFDAVIAVHLKGTFNVTRHAAEYWRDQAKQGVTTSRSIINTSSMSGLHGNLGQTNYAAAKAGVAAMTLVNAIELERYHVRANGIAPVARTRGTLASPGLDETLSGPLFAPGHVSPLVTYLARDDCPFNGQIFSVFGGGVGLYQGWSIPTEIPTDGLSLAELAQAMETFPTSHEVHSQMQSIAEATQ